MPPIFIANRNCLRPAETKYTCFYYSTCKNNNDENAFMTLMSATQISVKQLYSYKKQSNVIWDHGYKCVNERWLRQM